MIRMEYPTPDFKTRTHTSGRPEIFDEIRKRWVRLSPEEWVRQNVIRWMITVKGYPRAMVAVENADPQLSFHMLAAMGTGIERSLMSEMIQDAARAAGKNPEHALDLLNKIP